MEITEVKVFPVREEKLKAFVSVVFDHCFMVNDIKIIRGRQGLFISMPSRKKKNGEFKDVAHPLNNETRQRIEGLVLAEYERALDERNRAERDGAGRAKAEPIEAERDEAKRDEAKRDEAKRDEAKRDEAKRDAKKDKVASDRTERSRFERDGEALGTASAPPRPQEDLAPPVRARNETRDKDGAREPSPPGETEEEETAEKTLEEVEEMHLRDSFWTVP